MNSSCWMKTKTPFLKEELMSMHSPYASWSMALGTAGLFTLLFPVITLILGCAAIFLGALSCYRREVRQKRAVTGIVLGVCLVLLGAVLLYSIAALRPYGSELSRLWESMLRTLPYSQ